MISPQLPKSQINQQLTHPLELGLQRAAQKSYPHINGLYLLLRASGLSLIDTRSKKPRLILDPPVLESWRSLNNSERYFALLQAWWGQASGEIIGERGITGDILASTFSFIDQLPKGGSQTVTSPQDAEMFRFYPGYHNLALLELFGLLEIQIRAPVKGKGWQPKRIKITTWGKALLDSYRNCIRHLLDLETESEMHGYAMAELFEPMESFKIWSQAVLPHIQGWHKNLEIPELTFQAGTHHFKVSLGTACWRLIAVAGDATLEQLALAILYAFHFDTDHLYRFSYTDRFGKIIDIDHPYMTGEADTLFADEVKVGDLPLCKGMHIEFIFDFGDWWKFDLQTEGLNVGSAIKKPKVLKKHGRAPKQYGD